MPIDISVVLNLHREKELAAKTLRSLRDAADFAVAADIAVELIIVLDDACEGTTAVATDFQAGSFVSIKRLTVDNRSLALSRNDGVDASTGEFIYTIDGDDLYSYNVFVESLALVRKLGNKFIVLPEYLISFGGSHGLSVLTGSGALTPLLFPADHPYVSSIFGHRSAFEAHPYVHPRGDRGHAFEDWHMNAELIAAGFQFATARNVARYYRNHPDSIMAHARQADYPLTVGPTRLHEPETFVEICRPDVEAYETGTKIPATASAAGLQEAFVRNPMAHAFLKAAGRIEPLITLESVVQHPAYSARYISPEPGMAYYRFCEIVGNRRFDDVFVVPSFVHGGAEKYVIQIMNSLLRLDPGKAILVIAMEYADEHNTLCDLPPNACFLDAYRLGGCVRTDQLVELVMKLIEHTAPAATVHFRAGSACHELLKIGMTRLEPEQICYYHFFNHKAQNIDLDEPMHFAEQVSRIGGHVVSDCMASTKFADGTPNPEVSCIPAHCATAERNATTAMRKRLLWASRIADQKRCTILPTIAQLLGEHDDDVCIDLYGSAEERTRNLLPPPARQISYHGPFDSFADIGSLGHEIFLYTSWYDGMPNVVLEAMAHGKTVIAPDIGGIEDAIVDGQTGILLKSDPDDARMAKAYADAILWLLANPEQSARLGRNAKAYIDEMRTPERMDQALARLFPSKPKNEDAHVKHP